MQSLILDGGAMLVALLIVVAGSELFTNAVEHFGESFGLSEGLVGSVFAAVATALPETVVPIVAVFGGGGGASGHAGQSVGVGAIIGSSFMLSTLALTLVMLFSLPKRGLTQPFEAEPTGLRRDFSYFLCAFLIAGGSLFIPPANFWLRVLVCAILISIYIGYVVQTVRRSSALVEAGHGTSADNPLWLSRIGLNQNLAITGLQALVALIFIIVGAKGFVWGIERMADATQFPVLVMSLILVPIATEMPEKVNSILWIRRGRDTLAFGNITGAMVFQGTLLPAFGVFLTSWAPRADVLAAFAATLVCSSWVWLRIRTGRLTPVHLFVNAVGYAGFLTFIAIYAV
ncbi:MAG TPA: sodium:calcium antiporter [Gammaproteobacteria bacterium]|nr:sodium:calcium antiporter [Gammaproteobacteria bacterium]